MVKRQADGENAVIASVETAPEVPGEHGIARRAAAAKSRTKALARRLRKSGRMASLTADLSEGIEGIADLADHMIASFEQARRETSRIARESEEAGQLIEGLSAASREARELSGEHVIALEDLMGGFRQNADSTRHLISIIQNAAEHHSGILKTIQELTRATGEMDALSERAAHALDRADVSGINAALEAGKAGNRGAGFGVVAAMAQTAFGRFDHAAQDFATATGEMRAAHERLAGKTTEAADRIRAIVVMTKGVRNAFDDAAGVIEELRTLTRETTGRMEGIFEGIDAAAPSLADVPENVRTVLGSADFAAARIEDQEKAFAETADSADRLLAIISGIASTNDLPSVLDDIYTGTDDLTRAIGATVERLHITLESVRAAANEAAALRNSAGTSRETLAQVVGGASGVFAEAGGFGDRMSALRRNLENTLAVLTDVVRELDSLRDEEETISTELDALRPLYAGVSRFAARSGAFAGVMTGLAVNGGIEGTRMENGVFSALAGEFEAVAAELVELEDAADDLGTRLGERLSAMGRQRDFLEWRGFSGSFEGIIGNLRALVESRIEETLRTGERLNGALAGHGRRISDVMERTGAMASAAEGAARAVEAAAGVAEEQRSGFQSIIELAEKITTLTDEMYPDEG